MHVGAGKGSAVEVGVGGEGRVDVRRKGEREGKDGERKAEQRSKETQRDKA